MTAKNNTLEKALDQCMHLFWQQGYFNTPVDELVKISGINRVTLYKQFGGKEGIFVAMLKRYQLYITTQFIAPLRDHDDGLTAIHAFFEQFIGFSEQGQMQNGCLFIMTASDLPSHNPAIKSVVDDFLNQITTSFYKALERAKAQNKLIQTLDSKACSTFLVANIFGLFTLARATNNTHLVKEQVMMIKQFLHAYQDI